MLLFKVLLTTHNIQADAIITGLIYSRFFQKSGVHLSKSLPDRKHISVDDTGPTDAGRDL